MQPYLGQLFEQFDSLIKQDLLTYSMKSSFIEGFIILKLVEMNVMSIYHVLIVCTCMYVDTYVCDDSLYCVDTCIYMCNVYIYVHVLCCLLCHIQSAASRHAATDSVSDSAHAGSQHNTQGVATVNMYMISLGSQAFPDTKACTITCSGEGLGTGDMC